MRRKHSILIIDDTDFLPQAIADQLVKKGYSVDIVHTVHEGSNYLRRADPPTFILADRILENGPIEVRELVALCHDATNVSAEVLVYTDRDNLSEEKQYEILSKGAYRVLNKDDVEKLKDDVDMLISDFDERADLAEELNADTSEERSKFITALVGADVSLNVLDDKYRPHYIKSVPYALDQTTTDIPGKNVPERSGVCQNQCWLARFHAPVFGQKCWGCTVAEVFRSGTTVEALFLNRQPNGSVSWVDVQSKPIRSPTTGNIIAVREAVAAANEVVLANLTLERRLLLIGQSLIRAGFGRARIYTFDQDGNATLSAAAASNDNPLSPQSNYFESIRSLTLAVSACPYASEAHDSRIGLFVTRWHHADGPSPLSNRIELQLPYFDVPIYRNDGSLHSWLSVDFTGLDNKLRERALDAYARKETLTWLREEYGREIRLADDTEGKPGYREKFEIVRRARFGIYNAKSVDDAIEEIRNAFRELLPECRVTVRIKKESELQQFDRLCWRTEIGETIAKVSLDDQRSLAVATIRHPLPKWISNYPEYAKQAQQTREPLGYVPEGTQSAAELPLKLENILLGTLGISSPKSFRWAADGYKEPLIALAQEIALVLRDLALQETIDKAMNDRAAMIAYSISVSADGLWRHWAQQRLSEVSARVATMRTKLEKGSLLSSDIEEYLKSISGVIHTIQTAQPLRDAITACSLTKVLRRLWEIYAEKQPSPIFGIYDEVEITAPEFIVRSILMILLDNALWSIQNSGQGDSVNVNVQLIDNSVTIGISDNGPGIPKELQALIFRQPVQSSKGQGFGLLYARGAALQYGGDLSFSSLPTSTQFVLTLPVRTTSKGTNA